MYDSLFDFLSQHKCQKNEGGKNISHVGLTGGKYSIKSKAEYDDFLKLYFEDVLVNNYPAFLSERVGPVFTLFVDLDFPETGFEFLKANEMDLILTIFQQIEEVEDVVISTSNPKEPLKIHLNFPGLVVNSNIAKGIRNIFIEKLFSAFINLRPDLTRGCWEKIYDKAVYSSGLRMIGSRKAKDNPSIYKFLDEDYNAVVSEPKIWSLLQKTSLRIFDESDQGICEALTKYDKDEGLFTKINELERETDYRDNISKFISENKELLPNNELPEICSVKQIDNNLQIKLKNKICPFIGRQHSRTQSGGETTLYIWVSRSEYSLRCFNEECKEKCIPEVPLALPDSLEQESYMTKLVRRAVTSQTHFDIAQLFFEFYKDEYRVDSGDSKPQWYHFNGNRWVVSGSCYLRLSREFLYEAIPRVRRDEEMDFCMVKYLAMCNQLKMSGFKECVLKEAGKIFHDHDKKFIENLDENPNLMGFENGVLDFTDPKNIIHRDALPSDYLSFNTGINYEAFSGGNLIVKILKEIFVDEKLYDYNLKVMASCLVGKGDEKFHIWSGVGSNGKSTLVNLIEKTFGEYACGVPISLFTRARASSNNASPEVIRTKGKRFVHMQEPEHGDKLNVGLLKEITGGDKIVARELYKNSVEFKPQFKIFMLCNDMPVISATDNGTWRRVRVSKFKSEFIEPEKFVKAVELRGDEGSEYLFKKDTALLGAENLSVLRAEFAGLLVVYYKKLLQEGLQEPSEVVEYTRKYKEENDSIGMFVENEITRATEGNLTVNELWSYYSEWCRENGFTIAAKNRLEFGNKLSEKIKPKKAEQGVSNGKQCFQVNFTKG